MEYKGIELKEITEPQIFDPPKKMVVWNYDEGHPVGVRELPVIAILPRLQTHLNILCKDGNLEWWAASCAEIPEKPTPRRATWLELSKWCSKGNGLVLDYLMGRIDTGVMFKLDYQNNPVDGKIKVRKWDDTDWHEPTVDYLGIKE